MADLQDLTYKISFKTDSKGLNESNKKLNDIDKSFSSMHPTITKVGKAIAGAFAARTVYNFGKSLVDSYSNLESASAKVIATIDKEERTTANINKLRQDAIKFSSAYGISADKVAGAQENLASAGFKVKEITDALEPTMLLATAGQIDMGEAANNVSETIRSFGMDTKQAGHVVDLFAKAAADTNAQMPDMAEAMKYAGGPAHQIGMTLEDTAAAIGAMANNSVKGSMAGTALRGMFTRLINPSEDAYTLMKQIGFEGIDPLTHKIKPLPKLIGDFNKSTSKMNSAQKAATISMIFGQEALTGVSALISTGEKDLQKLSNGFKNSEGAAKDMADVQNNTVKGALGRLSEGLRNVGNDFMSSTSSGEGLKNFLNALTDSIPKVRNELEYTGKILTEVFGWIMDNKDTIISAFTGILATIMTYKTIGLIISLFGKWKTAVEGVTIAQGLLNFVMIENPIGAVIAVVAGLTAAFITAWNTSESFRNALSNLWDSMKFGAQNAINYAIDKLNEFIPYINKAILLINKIPGVDIGPISAIERKTFAEKPVAAGGAAAMMSAIPKMANGGITTGPTTALIGEGKEREAVIPLSKLDNLLNTGSVSGKGNGGNGMVFAPNIKISVNAGSDAEGTAIAVKKAVQEAVDEMFGTVSLQLGYTNI